MMASGRSSLGLVPIAVLLSYLCSAVPGSGASLMGSVFEPGGVNEYRGVAVALSGDGGSMFVTTDAVGRFLFRPIPPGEYTVIVPPIGNKEDDVRFLGVELGGLRIIGENDAIEVSVVLPYDPSVSGLRGFVLWPGDAAFVEGVVIKDGRPASAATVCYVTTSGHRSCANVNSLGYYSMYLPIGLYRVSVRLPDRDVEYDKGRLRIRRLRPIINDLALDDSREGFVRIQLKGCERRGCLACASVVLEEVTDGRKGKRFEARAVGGGEFEAKSLPPGRYRVRMTCDDGTWVVVGPVVLRKSGAISIDFVLPTRK